jgi:hypothetical protein
MSDVRRLNDKHMRASQASRRRAKERQELHSRQLGTKWDGNIRSPPNGLEEFKIHLPCLDIIYSLFFLGRNFRHLGIAPWVGSRAAFSV